MKVFTVLEVLAIIISLASATDYEEALAETEEAFPGIFDCLPEVIRVVYDNGAYADFGKNVTPTETKNQPSVDWSADNETYYSLIMVDPDGPYRNDSFLRDIMTWWVGNIPGKNISAGEVLAEYVSAAPPKDGGGNRYFFFVNKQPGKVDYQEKYIDRYTIDGRFNVRTQELFEKYNLDHPVGFNYLTAYFDEQTTALYDQLNCCKDL